MSERWERLDRAAREAVETWSNNTHDQRRLREVISDAVVAAVDAETAPLLETVTRMVEETTNHTETWLEWPYHWEDVVQELNDLRTARKES